MSWLTRLRNFGRDERLAREISREMQFHLAERAEELRAGGMTEVDAWRKARRQFGNPTALAERTRDADVLTWLDSLRADVRYALRALRHSPAFAVVAIASLALGIGANTTIYTLIDAVVLRALPVAHPEELMQVKLGNAGAYFTNPIWEQVRDHQNVFSAVAAFSEADFNIADGGAVRRARGEYVSGDYFRVFGIASQAGRVLTTTDDVRGCPALAVISDGFWRSEFAGSTAALGAKLPIEGKTFHVIGVAAPGFNGPEVGREPQIYVPLCAEAVVHGKTSALDRRSSWWMRVIGRRAPGVSPEQAVARLEALAPSVYAATVPEKWGAKQKLEYQRRSLSAVPAEHGLSNIRQAYSKALMIMMGAVGLVLLIACANVANLLLARAAARDREVAIRLAIGAARRRLVRQLFTESALLALLGAFAGLLVARWGTHALAAMISTDANPVALDLTLNPRVLGFTILVAGITAAIFGLAPAWRGTRVSPNAAMKAGGRGVAEGHRRFTLGKSLVVAQVALSLTLLVGAGLFMTSLRNLATLDPGFRADGILIVNAGFRRSGLTDEQLRPLEDAVLQRVRAIPGVTAASASDITPMGTSSWNDEVYASEGGQTLTSVDDRLAWFNQVSDGYFATLGTRLLAGRDFDATDAPGGPRTAIVNESAARRFFGKDSPIGKQFRLKSGDTFGTPYTVVGVVEDAKYQSLREKDSKTIYLPRSQDAWAQQLTLEVRTAGDPTRLAPAITRVLAEVHRSVAVDFAPMTAQLARSLQRERVLAILSTVFGSVGLALAVLGLYGVMSYTVARRRNEIGVRIALGADRSQVVRMVLGDVTRVVLIGVALGATGAVASSKLVQSFLFGIEPNDPRVVVFAAILLAVVALFAGALPALSASRVDPVLALRED